MNIIMMGIQGSGKGTQAKLLAKHTGFPHVSVGDLFRAHISQGSDLGKQAKVFTDRGQLVPDELVMDMIRDRLQQPDVRKGIILDGFPRNPVQMAAMEYLKPVDHAIFLELDDATAIKRLTSRSECSKCGIIYGKNRPPKNDNLCDKCGQPLKIRTDDQDVEAIRVRLKAFHESLQDLLNYYRWKGVLRETNASGTVLDVFEELRKQLLSP